ncbi:ABC transporter ATP-binding protein [Pseudoalteromonas luteoviolacea]|uniref:ABC transporter ATP-binding protein n=1 Tax=Pseudoalteromonas luteoviolacea TaxID=43657 RepID=A0A0C1Q846_9GAMM|nr:DNA sulfur modification protein DndD [Pseudoalteromonas luteoviolacea]KID55665.1 ABC transporter ATP-binding protein [Pseudoalteromonas luteoviolacea]KID56386.1 ABC transporter ATP-binding protein [Pseudoalteromonas luteoviolacea]
MLLQSLTLHNFGIYKGTHSVDLTVSNDKPVILFGGLNGGGKTTFLDALQLVLYGKHAKCSNRGNLAYGTYLASTLNRYVSKTEQVSLELTFSHTTDTEAQTFTVRREWKIAKQVENSKDKVTVSCNGEHDQYIGEHWDEFVNEFIPMSLSDLFFFDGEKIENLAHPERSNELIKTGIENLLGLDLLSQLHLDLNNIERKRKAENLDTSVIEKVETCEADIEANNDIIEALSVEIAKLKNQQGKINVDINKARQKVRDSGAHLIEERDQIRFELGAIAQKLKDSLQQRVKLDAGIGPLGLIKPLLKQTHKQAVLEEQASEASALNKAIESYEATLLKSLEGQTLPEAARTALENSMASMATERQALANVESYVGLPSNLFNGLEAKLELDQQEREALIKEREILLEKKALFEKKEESIPDYETVKHVLSELAQFEAEFKNAQTLIKAKSAELEQAQAKHAVLNQRYTNLLTQQSKDTFEQKRSLQVVDHIGKLKETMQGFAKSLIKENIELLQDKITEKFIALTRKEQLISGVHICSTSFSLTLLAQTGEELSPSRLSAGERQLLAIAILWGLSEASGKELPTVIDTPLGRLDGKHRTRLIEGYFPFAANQVLLLSTDEEIMSDYYSKLKPAISREYHIRYNEQATTSTISEGYF